jgi:acetyltransferase
MRPIRPDDEDEFRAMVASLTPEDRRFRFFAPRKDLDPQLAARLTQIDYDRELALIAFPADATDEIPWGVGRIHADPDNQRAEFALTVRSDRTGRGLGRLLLQTLMEVAKLRGIREIWGDVLSDNNRMLDLCQRMGFARTHAPDGVRVTRVP